MFDAFFSLFSIDAFSGALKGIWIALPIWLPVILFALFLQTYIRYIRTKYIAEQGSVLLELRLPKELLKSPAAMEIALQAMAQPSVGSYLDVYLKGRVRPWFSLELVSIEGQVRFFIWTHKKFKNVVESQIYSQFPTVEIHEVKDYSLEIPFDESSYSYWGMQLQLNKADVFPIKSYIDYGMDKDPKEEFKIDPITPMVEFLGSLKAGEQVWIQILIQSHRKETLKDARLMQKEDWKKSAKKAIDEVFKEVLVKPEEGKIPSLRDLTDMQKETINSIQRNLAKTPFDTMIRGLYVSRKDSFNPVTISGLTGCFKQFNSGNLNGFKPKLTTSFDYPWQDFQGTRLTAMKRKLLDAFKRRSFFHPPYRNFGGKPFILTTEELATIFHFPGAVAATPTFSRIVSKKGEPPANLPL